MESIPEKISADLLSLVIDLMNEAIRAIVASAARR